MTDETRSAPETPPSPDGADPIAESGRAAERRRQRARTKRRIARREACFELLSAGYTYQQIAATLKVSLDSVRRDVERAIDRRRLAAPERYIHLQVDRLTRALCSMDQRVGDGDVRAVKPLLSLIGALDRYHGLAALGREGRAPALPPPLAPLALAPPVARSSIVASFDAQALENMG